MKYETYWKFIERPKRIIERFFKRKDNEYYIMKASKKLKGELVINDNEICRFLGWIDSTEDYYWALLDSTNKVFFASCVGDVIRLKRKIKTWEYLHLEHIWEINGRTLEYGLELAKTKEEVF